MAKKNDTNLYTEDSIITETPREFTRRVPSTYLGSSRHNSNLVKEVFANSIDEHVIGHGNIINITIDTKKNTYIVEDNGQGFLINAGIDEDGETILQRSFDKLNTSGKTSEDGVYEGTSLGLNGIGAKLTNWLSESLNVITYRDGEFEEIDFVDGIFKKRKVGKAKHASGTIVTWHPDPQFFAENTPDMAMLKSHFEVTAALCPQLTINLDYNGEKTTYSEPGGINAYVDKKSKNKELFSNRFNIERSIGKDVLNICLTYTSDYSENIDSYVNYGHTDSGAHIQAFHTAFTRAVNKYATDTGLLKKSDRNFNNTEICEGLYVVFNMVTTTAKYDAQNKSRIDDIDAKIINSVIGGDFATWLINNPSDAKIITERALLARKAREAAQKAKEKIRDANGAKSKKSIFADLPSKLSDAYPKNRKDRSKCELMITEGDSAGSSINAVKDSEFQAVYPIRGKILNCSKATPDKVFGNAEIAGITKALGLDIDKTSGKLIYDEKKLRYSKIIIACFTGDTKVKSLDGKSYSFKELVDSNTESLWVYSMDNHGNVVPGLAKDIRKVNTTTELLEIELDSGEVIKCTPDHYMMTAEGNYVMAKDLIINDSLMPLYIKKDASGHLEYFDRNTSKYNKVHIMVADNIYPVEKEEALTRLASEEHKPHQNNIVVHHKNLMNPDNKTDNRPENLEWLTNKEHFIKHGKSGYTAYNVSQKHRDRTSKLHKQNVYKTWLTNGYNKSEKHKQDVRNAAARGAYDGGWDNYNYSEKHHTVCVAINKSEKHILSVKRSPVGKTIRFLEENNLPFDEATYNFYKHNKAPMYSRLLELFDSYDEVIEYAHSKEFDISNYKPSLNFNDFTKVEFYKNGIAYVIKMLIKNNLEFNEKNYDDMANKLVTGKYNKIIPYKFITKLYDSYKDAYNTGINYNHSIKSIKTIKVENEPVYCMNVEKYHNFALDCGVFVKNCDADADGSDIAMLLCTVFNWLCPELFTNGHIYRVYGALYKIILKDGSHILIQNDAELEEWKKKNPKASYKLSRAKGLGELTKEETFEQLVDPSTRNLKRLVVDNYELFEKYLEIFKGPDGNARKEYYENGTI